MIFATWSRFKSKYSDINLVGGVALMAVLLMSLASITSIPYHHAQIGMAFFFLMGISLSRSNSELS